MTNSAAVQEVQTPAERVEALRQWLVAYSQVRGPEFFVTNALIAEHWAEYSDKPAQTAGQIARCFRPLDVGKKIRIVEGKRVYLWFVQIGGLK